MNSNPKQYNVPNVGKPGKLAQAGSPVLGTHVYNAGVGATLCSSDLEETRKTVRCPKCGNEDLRTVESELVKCNRCGRTFSTEGGVACMLNNEEQKDDQGALRGMFTEKK